MVNVQTINADVNCRINSYHVSEEDNSETAKLIPTPKLYKRRYLMLLLYGPCTFLNAFQWIQFAIIASVVTCYYDVSISEVNWTANLFALMYMPFIFPVTWMMSNRGLRMTLIIAAAGNTLGAAIQCLSVASDRFYVVFLSQAVSATAQTFSVSVPPFLAALWFGPKEVSFACAVGIILNQLGNAIGFLIPPLLVPSNCSSKEHITIGLTYLAVGLVIANFVSFLAIVLFFEDKPPSPPSTAQAKKHDDTISTFKWTKIMLQNKNFCLLILSSGLLLSVAYAIATILNQMVVRIFPGKTVDAGWIGLLCVFGGMTGNLISGHILDKTKKFRESAIAITLLSLFSMVFYTAFSSKKILWLHYVMLSAIGFFSAGSLAIAFEFSAELTYPGPEGISGTLMYASPQLLGIPVTMLSSWLQQTYSDLSSNIFFCSLIAISLFLLAFVKSDTKRTKQEAKHEPLE